jgi:4-hydroxybenzoate polyprenyltransferase
MSSLRGWLEAAHPFPLTMVLVLTALVGVSSAHGEPHPGHLALLLVAMFGSQLAIGWSNDYLDRTTDAVFQPSKPIPSGLLSASQMPGAIVAALGVSAVCVVVLGLTPLLWLLAGTACGLAYNFGLKDTWLSAAPFIVALAVLPAFVCSSLDVFRDEFLWVYVFGAPLALAAHIANTLPDIETDSASGRRGLAVRLGRRWSLSLLAACLIAPLPAVVATLGSVNYDVKIGGTDWYLLSLVVMAYVALSLFTAFWYAKAGDRAAEVLGFRLVALAGVLFTAGWLAAI